MGSQNLPLALLPPVLLLAGGWVSEWGQVSPILVPQFPLSGVTMAILFPTAPKAWVSCECKGPPRSWIWPLAPGGGTRCRGLCSAFSAQSFTVARLWLRGCARASWEPCGPVYIPTGIPCNTFPAIASPHWRGRLCNRDLKYSGKRDLTCFCLLSWTLMFTTPRWGFPRGSAGRWPQRSHQDKAEL